MLWASLCHCLPGIWAHSWLGEQGHSLCSGYGLLNFPVLSSMKLFDCLSSSFWWGTWLPFCSGTRILWVLMLLNASYFELRAAEVLFPGHHVLADLIAGRKFLIFVQCPGLGLLCCRELLVSGAWLLLDPGHCLHLGLLSLRDKILVLQSQG